MSHVSVLKSNLIAAFRLQLKSCCQQKNAAEAALTAERDRARAAIRDLEKRLADMNDQVRTIPFHVVVSWMVAPRTSSVILAHLSRETLIPCQCPHEAIKVMQNAAFANLTFGVKHV